MTAVLVAAVMLVVLAPVQAAVGQPPDAIGVRLLDAPVSRQDDPRATRSIIDHLQPGDVIQRRILVANTYDRGYDVPVYAAGATIVDGTFTPDEEEAGSSLLADWVSVSPSPLPLGPQASGEITVTIRVPEDAPDGEFYGFVFAEAPVQGDQIQVINRAGVRIYLSIGDGPEPATDFEVDSLVAVRNESGAPEVRVNVTNTGRRALDLVGELTLDDGPGGLSAGPFTAQGTTTLGIGDAGQLFVPLDTSLPDGPWLATFVARSGTTERTAEATITFPGATGEADPAEAEETGGQGGDTDGDGLNDERVDSQRRVLLPAALVLLVAAVLALYMMLQWKRRQEDGGDEDELVPAGATSAAGEDDGG